MDSTLVNEETTAPKVRMPWYAAVFWAVFACLVYVVFRQAYGSWYYNVFRPNSYYSHAVLVPFVSLLFAWRMRNDLVRLPRESSKLGYVVLALSCALVLTGDLLGIRMLGVAVVLPFIMGLILIFLGWGHLRRLWFPLAFLLFMIPLPEALTTSITFRVKMLATDGAILLARTCLLPMIRDGSYVRIGHDQLLVGDVCGGLRSLISLLALGAIMSYISDTRPMGRLLILVVSAPIAVLSNVLRIFFLCVVTRFWGSEVATGWVHDISGLLIYAIALTLMFGLVRILHRVAPSRPLVPEGAVA